MEERLQSHSDAPINIVLADDDSDDRELFQEAAMLVAPDIKITMARDGEELMEYLTSGGARPDLIFLDLNMPKKNGKECLKEIQEDRSLRDIPVVIYTTSLNQLDVDDAYNVGARRFLRKPNSFEDLKQLLQRALKANLEQPGAKESFVLNTKDKMAV